MTLEEALDESMRQFLAGKGNTELDKVQPSKYTNDYFNRIQEELKSPPKKLSRMEQLKKSMR